MRVAFEELEVYIQEMITDRKAELGYNPPQLLTPADPSTLPIPANTDSYSDLDSGYGSGRSTPDPSPIPLPKHEPRHEPTDRNDLFHNLIQASVTDKEEGGLSDAELIGNIYIFLLLRPLSPFRFVCDADERFPN